MCVSDAAHGEGLKLSRYLKICTSKERRRQWPSSTSLRFLDVLRRGERVSTPHYTALEPCGIHKPRFRNPFQENLHSFFRNILQAAGISCILLERANLLLVRQSFRRTESGAPVTLQPVRAVMRDAARCASETARQRRRASPLSNTMQDSRKGERMSRKKAALSRKLALSLLLTGTAGVVATTPSAVYAATTGTIQGTVKDAAGNPVAGAQVFLLPSGQQTRTDASGKYTFAGVEPTNYTIRVESPRFQTSTSPTSVTQDNTSTLDFSLQARTISTGTTRVLGSPVARNVPDDAVHDLQERRAADQVAAEQPVPVPRPRLRPAGHHPGPERVHPHPRLGLQPGRL